MTETPSSKEIKVFPVLSCSVFCPGDSWGHCAHEEWRCSLSSITLYSLLVTAEGSVFMKNGGTPFHQLLCGLSGESCGPCAHEEWRSCISYLQLLSPIYWWQLKALCLCGMKMHTCPHLLYSISWWQPRAQYSWVMELFLAFSGSVACPVDSFRPWAHVEWRSFLSYPQQLCALHDDICWHCAYVDWRCCSLFSAALCCEPVIAECLVFMRNGGGPCSQPLHALSRW